MARYDLPLALVTTLCFAACTDSSIVSMYQVGSGTLVTVDDTSPAVMEEPVTRCALDAAVREGRQVGGEEGDPGPLGTSCD